MEDELFDDINTLEVQKNHKTTFFKKKNIKGKKSALRVKISFDDVDEDEDSESLILATKLKKNSHRFKSTEASEESKRSVIEKAKSWTKNEDIMSNEDEGKDDQETFKSFVKTIPVDEDGPVIEDLDRVLKRTTSDMEDFSDIEVKTEYIPLENNEKKYVPIEHDKEQKITAKEYRNEYKNEIDDLDDDDDLNSRNFDDDDVKVLSPDNADIIADNDDLDLSGKKGFQINNEIYDLELNDDESDASDSSNSASVRMEWNSARATRTPKVSKILSIDEQIDLMKKDIETLTISVSEQKSELKASSEKAENLILRKNELQIALDS